MFFSFNDLPFKTVGHLEICTSAHCFLWTILLLSERHMLFVNKGNEKHSKSKETNVKPHRLVFSWDKTDRTQKLCSFQQVINMKLKSIFNVNIILLLIFIVDLSQKSLFPWKLKCFVFTCYSLFYLLYSNLQMYCLFYILKGKWCLSNTYLHTFFEELWKYICIFYTTAFISERKRPLLISCSWCIANSIIFVYFYFVFKGSFYSLFQNKLSNMCINCW